RERAEVHGLAARDHSEGEVADLLALHAVEVDRHGHGRHLLVRDVAASVRVDEPVDLLGRQRSVVALGVDQIDDVERFNCHGGAPYISFPLVLVEPTSQAQSALASQDRSAFPIAPARYSTSGLAA